jgi:hypothetical protein
VAHGSKSAGVRSVLLAATLCAVALTTCLAATPARAVVADIRGHAYGVTPIRGVNPGRLPAVKRALSSARTSPTGPLPYDSGGPLFNHGGPVMHTVTTHVIYWDPSANFTAATKEVVHKFFADVAQDSGLASNVFGVAGQYNDGSGRAAYSSTVGSEGIDSTAYGANTCTIPNQVDKSAFYTNCITDEKLQTELSAYITKEGLPTGPTHQYFVLLPHKVVTCLPEELAEGKLVHPCSNNFYCAYHSSIEGGTSNEIIYSDIPFSLLDSGFVKDCQADGNAQLQHPNGDITGTDENTRFADVALKYTSHEYIEAATDPLGDAWWENANGQEIGDKCNLTGSGIGADPNAFAPTLGGSKAEGTLFDQIINTTDHYYVQSEWDNAAKACTMKPVPITSAGFTAAPATGVVGTPISFKGIATDVYSGLSYGWKWGDGSESAGANPSHTYGAPGSYEVTMTPKDEFTFATAAPVVHTISVNNPALPPPPSSPPPVLPSEATAAVSTPSSTAAVILPNSSFTQGETVFNQKTGELTFTQTVGDPGTFSWLLTFQNGKFGVFAASSHKCKAGLVRLGGKCRSAKIVFARGSRAVAAPGLVTFRLKPSASALKALKNALKQKKGLPVTATFTFQSARGGSPVSRTRTITVKLKKR